MREDQKCNRDLSMQNRLKELIFVIADVLAHQIDIYIYGEVPTYRRNYKNTGVPFKVAIELNDTVFVLDKIINE